MTRQHPVPGFVDLYWIPLGAGGSGFVRLVGKVYEAIDARLDGREPLDLFHASLRVRTADGLFLVELMLPSPAGDLSSRGVVLVGAVGGRWLARWGTFRYEVRRWRDGVFLDADPDVVGPERLSDDSARAARLLELTRSVPRLIWGRDQLGTGEMWNSNSVVSWLLAKAALPVENIHPPRGGRAPGWAAGIVVARRGLA